VILGSWNPSVVLTYLGAAVAAYGIGLAAAGSLRGALTCLVVAGILDLADGPIARRVKRDDKAKRFGVVLDTVADVVSFVALPVAVLFAVLPLGAAALPAAIWVVAGLARLAHFTANDADAEGAVSHYRGVPVTYAALVIPLVCLTKPLLPGVAFQSVITVAMAALAALFVLDVKVPKPRGIAYAGFGLLAVIVVALLWIVRL